MQSDKRNFTPVRFLTSTEKLLISPFVRPDVESLILCTMTVFHFTRNCLIVCAVVALIQAPGCDAFTQELCDKVCAISDWFSWFCDADVEKVEVKNGISMMKQINGS